jgi:putative ABC transport system permease protein
MSGNSLKIALRTIRNHKFYSSINIVGLALGLACAFLMLVYIVFETSYDRHHTDADRIYRAALDIRRGDRIQSNANLIGTYPFENEFPEVEKSARLFTYSWKEKTLVANLGGEKAFFEENFFLADPSLFDVFTFQVLRGDLRSSLAGKDGLVISASAARRFFGDENPVGRVLSVKNLRQADFRVGAVIADMPRNSHVRLDFIAPLAAGEILFWENFEARNSFYTYLLLRRGASATALEAKLPAFLSRHLGEDGRNFRIHLQPMTSIHLRSHYSDEISTNGDINRVYVFAVLAFIILAVASINFVNLATARSINRAREVGLKKVIGARRGELVVQFVGEAVLFAVLALPIAGLIVQAILPAFNAALGLELPLTFPGCGRLYAGAVLLTLLVGLAAGAYPAFVMSGFRPIQVLKGRFQLGSKGVSLRRALVVLQYAASIILLVGTLVVAAQMRYIGNKKLGFDRDQIVIVPVKDYETIQGYGLAKTAFLRSPAVLGVTASRGLPSRMRSVHGIAAEGVPGGEDVEMPVARVDFDFLSTFGISLAAGRDFSAAVPSDSRTAYIVNESAVRAFGWANPLGKKIQFSNKDLARPVYEPGQVLGVVKDFHFQSLHEPIQPLVLKIETQGITHIAVKIAPGRTRETLDFLAARWKSVFPGRPFDFSFFDEDVDRIYQADRRTGRVFGLATVLSLVIAGLGLFGLASFSAAQRTREIGIRKVLGATTGSIWRLLSGEFNRLILVANLIAWPPAYFLMGRWLRGFAYRVPLDPVLFALAGAASFAVAMAAVTARAARAAAADPAESLRYE